MWRKGWPIGAVVILGTGLLIIFALVLPPTVWWFILGVALVVLGVWLIRRSFWGCRK